MRHLSEETLAALVDHTPTAVQQEHLDSCPPCAEVLQELREQTGALASLPALRPPAGDWDELEARLIEKGLVDKEAAADAGDPAAVEGEGVAAGGTPPPWLRAAAAVVLFLGGTAFGAWVVPVGQTGVGDVLSGGGERWTEPEVGTVADGSPGTMSSIDEAAALLRSAEDRYVDALMTYRDLAREADASGSQVPENPAARFAALEALVAASQEAIRQAPADPFFNGVLASTVAERQAAIRQISTSSDDSWF